VEDIASASYSKGSYLCTLPSPALVEVVRPLRAAGYHIHYDIMDDWEGFHTGGEAPWFSAAVEREIVILADTVSAVSDKLVQKFDHLRSDIAVVRNGYQPAALGCDQFIAARAPLEGPKVVGYFGHFSDAWFDWDTVIYAAQKLPEVEFEMIGWAVSEPTRMRLNAVPNIRLVGIVPQKELHRYARKWWAGMIPFQATEVSAAVDPLKIYEYLHLGLPTVVTGIPGIADYPLVQFAGDRESFIAALTRIVDRPDEQRLSEVAEFLKSCVWEERFARLNSMLVEPAGLAFLYAR
jgi:glycosyltransferase involved in cell wall biosynthesis